MPSTPGAAATTYASGRPLSGAAAHSARMAAERRQQAEEHLAEFSALAGCVVELFGTDMIRAKLGRDKALRLLKLAGLDTERIGGNWASSEPVRRQVSQAHPGQGYNRDPRHDPRVTQAIVNGASNAEVNRLIGQVTDELLADPPPTIGPPGSYRDQPSDTAIPGVSYQVRDGVAVPAQRSTTLRDWTDFPDHQPGYAERASPGVGGARAPQQQAPAGCGHAGSPAGAKFCITCGDSLTGQAVD